MWVVGLLAANGAVLVTGLADAVETVVEHAQPRTITLITGKDGKQIAVDPNTPAGWKAIADAEREGAEVTTVTVPAEAVAASEGDETADPLVTIPGVDAGDLQSLLTGTVDHIVTTVRTIVDSTGQTVVSIVDGTVSSIVDGTVSTVSSIVDDGTSTVSSIVDDGTSTVSSIVDDVPTTVNVPTTSAPVPTTVNVPTTSAPVPTTAPPVSTTVQSTVTTIQNTVTTVQNTVTTIVGGLGL